MIELLKKHFPNFTFEIVNFDTKGDQILNIALPKNGDKGLFSRELEDGLKSGTIDFVVHSLKDLPCQTSPENLIIAGIPERENPYDALVMAKRWQGVKHSLDDLDANSVVGTSSLRRISQLKHKYPHLKFETIRGNLQTRFAKLDDEVEKKYDAIILAVAGLKRLGYDERITQVNVFLNWILYLKKPLKYMILLIANLFFHQGLAHRSLLARRKPRRSGHSVSPRRRSSHSNAKQDQP